MTSEAVSVEERVEEAWREAYRTGKPVRVVASTDDDARWLTEQSGRNISRGDYIELVPGLSDV